MPKNDMISNLFNVYSRSVTPEEKEKAYADLERTIQESVYFIPQKHFGLYEEDCAEFMLHFQPRIRGIIESYNLESGDFYSFLMPALERSLKTFWKKKQKRMRIEDAVFNGHEVFNILENHYDETMEDCVVSEMMQSYGTNDRMEFKRLLYIFSQNKTARKRFYSFFFSLAVLMDEEQIEKCCSSFCYDYGETMQLVATAKKLLAQKTEERNLAIEKRNLYFAKTLYVENELSMMHYVADYSKDNEYQTNLDRYRNYSKVQENIIRSHSKRASRNVVGKVLNTKADTIALYVFTSKNLLEWCLDNEYTPGNTRYAFGVAEKVITQALDDGNIVGLTSEALPMLSPFKIFKIDVSKLN